MNCECYKQLDTCIYYPDSETREGLVSLWRLTNVKGIINEYVVYIVHWIYCTVIYWARKIAEECCWMNLSDFENGRFSKLIHALFAVVHNATILNLNNFSERREYMELFTKVVYHKRYLGIWNSYVIFKGKKSSRTLFYINICISVSIRIVLSLRR